MTVKEMIKQLMDMPMDKQVVDTDGSPIMYLLFDWNRNAVRLEPKSQMDINEELKAFFEEARETAMSDYDVCMDLQDRGYTLDDLKAYSESVYEWALNTEFDWG